MSVGVNCTIRDLLFYNESKFVNDLSRFLVENDLPVSQEQKDAWIDCLYFLKEQFNQLDEKHLNTYILFEYMLPLEKGRRPDVIILSGKKVIILEFKAKRDWHIRDLEQVIGYREDIRHFPDQTGKWDLDVEGYLVLTKNLSEYELNEKGIKLLNKYNFFQVIKTSMITPMVSNKVDLWINSLYHPIPSIIEATQQLFLNGNLPYIKSIAEGDIAHALKSVSNIIKNNEGIDHAKKIILVSGVPGSGKTLVGIKTVYDYNKESYDKGGDSIGALYLSGNGPLVNVLQTQLSSYTVNGKEGKSFIRSMYSFKKEYLDSNKVSPQKVLVFDEAQRAWDSERMQKDYNEVEAILKIADKAYDKNGHVTIICLIGDGQAIHLGEEKGLSLWTEVLKCHAEWKVYLPTKYVSAFKEVKNTLVVESLHLDTSIRTKFIDTSKWIELVLQGDSILAREELANMQEKGFRIRMTSYFERIQKVMPMMKISQPNDKYGLFVSSKTSSFRNRMKAYTNGIYKTSFVNDNEAGKWFMNDCEELQIAASEFLCQGLEIEMPIIMFGGDYYIHDNHWKIDPIVRNKNSRYENIDQIVENIYRVLMSRGRQGIILYVPRDNVFWETYKYFSDMGIKEL